MVCCFAYKMSSVRHQWLCVFHYKWLTSLIKPRLLFSPCMLCILRTFSFSQINYNNKYKSTSGSRRGRNRRPPQTAADLWFVYAQNAIFLIFSSLDSLAINFKHNCKRNMATTRKNMAFTSTLNTFNEVLPLPPSLTKSTPPPPQVKSWIRHWRSSIFLYIIHAYITHNVCSIR